MLVCKLIEYSDNYLNTSGSSWQYYGDEPSLNNADTIVDFTDANHNSKSSKCKQKTTGVTDANGKKMLK